MEKVPDSWPTAPTHFTTNKYTYAFQEFVNTYGIPRYVRTLEIVLRIYPVHQALPIHYHGWFVSWNNPPFSLFLSLSHTHTHTYTVSLSPTHFLSPPLSLSLSLSPSLFFSFFLSPLGTKCPAQCMDLDPKQPMILHAVPRPKAGNIRKNEGILVFYVVFFSIFL